ncbi:MAG: hypothetical protein NVSMB44_35710 [Ktedonobacteraceae bacterium]
MWEKRRFRTLLLMNQPGSVVSKAVCPANVRYSVALGKMAQQRRLLIMLAAGLMQALRGFCARYMPAVVMRVALVRLVKLCFVLFLLSDGVFLCMALYNQLLLLNRWFIFALFFVVLAIAMTCVVFDEILAYCKSTAYKNRSSSRTGSRPARSTSARAWKPGRSGQRVQARPRYFPETPLPLFSLPPWSRRSPLPEPTAPRIRVWETIDMSSTNVEHFLDADAEWPRPPLSQMSDDDGYKRP